MCSTGKRAFIRLGTQRLLIFWGAGYSCAAHFRQHSNSYCSKYPITPPRRVHTAARKIKVKKAQFQVGRWTRPRWGCLTSAAARTCCEMLDLTLLPLSLSISPTDLGSDTKEGISAFNFFHHCRRNLQKWMQINSSLHLNHCHSCSTWHRSTDDACTKEQMSFAFLLLPGVPRKYFSSTMKLPQTLTEQLICNKMKSRAAWELR